MRSGVIAQKIGMTRVYNDAGEHVPVTVLALEGCQVVSHRTVDVDGYTAVQLGAGTAKAKNVNKPQRGHFGKAEVEPKARVVEFRVSDDALVDVDVWRDAPKDVSRVLYGYDLPPVLTFRERLSSRA